MDPSDRPHRPVLLPGLRRLWRDRETLQLGRAPGPAYVLAGIDESVRSALALLDGTRDSARLADDAQRAGCPPERTDELLGLLGGAGLLEDAARGVPSLLVLPPEERERRSADVRSLSILTRGRPQGALARRAAARLQVRGAGRVGALLAVALASEGIGCVDVVDEGTTRPCDVGAGGLLPEDVGRSRGGAARDRVRASAPSVTCTPLTTPDLVVLAPAGALPDDAAPELVRRRAPHLLAEVRGTVGVVGPLVLPGRTSCLHCHDLTRTDHDPGWPWLAAQLASPPSGTAPCDGALAMAVASQAVMQVLALLDEVVRPVAVDGTLELALPDHRWRRRSWTRHPACGCADEAG